MAVTSALWLIAATGAGETAFGDYHCVVQLNGTNLADADMILLSAAGCGTDSAASSSDLLLLEFRWSYLTFSDEYALLLGRMEVQELTVALSLARADASYDLVMCGRHLSSGHQISILDVSGASCAEDNSDAGTPSASLTTPMSNSLSQTLSDQIWIVTMSSVANYRGLLVRWVAEDVHGE